MNGIVQRTLFLLVFFPFCVRAESGELTWVGKTPLSEVRRVELDCGDASYNFVTEHRQHGVELRLVERQPGKFSNSVKESIRSLIGEFISIDPLRFSCGAGPKDGGRQELKVRNANRDFSGQLHIELRGYHRTDILAAEEKCREGGGVFEPKTLRMLIVSQNDFGARPGVIGQCINWSSDGDKRGEN